MLARESVSVVEWLEYQLHPWSSYVIVPVFALANAGVVISSDSIADAAASPVTHGIVVGLVVGKLVGIFGPTWLACRLGFGALPDGTRWPEVVGIAVLGGIGFTVSLFVVEPRVPRQPGSRQREARRPRGIGGRRARSGRRSSWSRREAGPARAGPERKKRIVESGGVADLLGHGHADRNEDQDDEELLHHKPFRRPSPDIVGRGPRQDNWADSRRTTTRLQGRRPNRSAEAAGIEPTGRGSTRPTRFEDEGGHQTPFTSGAGLHPVGAADSRWARALRPGRELRRRAGRGRRCRSTGGAASTSPGPRSGGCAHG